MDSKISSIMEEYEETVEELAEVRTQYSKRIEKYLSKITEAEIEKLKRMKYKELNTPVPEIKLDFCDSFKSFTDSEDQGFHEQINKNDRLINDIQELKDIVEKIEPSRKM